MMLKAWPRVLIASIGAAATALDGGLVSTWSSNDETAAVFSNPSAASSFYAPALPVFGTSDASTNFDEDLLSAIEQINAYSHKWHVYLSNLCQPGGDLSVEHVNHVRSFWQTLTSKFGLSLSLPITQPTEEGSVQLAWNKAGEYIDIDIYSDRTISWFYRNRVTGAVDGSGDEPVTLAEALDTFCAYLGKFAKA